MEKRAVITEEEKKEIRGGLTHALERTLELYGGGKHKNLKRALDEGYGVLRGFYNALWIVYTMEAVEDELGDEIRAIWEVYRQRVNEAI